MDRDLIGHVPRSSDPTLRALFAEDAAALAGLVIADGGLALYQTTGSPVPDSVGGFGPSRFSGGARFIRP